MPEIKPPVLRVKQVTIWVTDEIALSLREKANRETIRQGHKISQGAVVTKRLLKDAEFRQIWIEHRGLAAKENSA